MMNDFKYKFNRLFITNLNDRNYVDKQMDFCYNYWKRFTKQHKF